MSKMTINTPVESNAAGITYGLAAFILWGLAPIYFKELSHVSAMEFLTNRVAWSFVFLLFLLFFRRTIPTLIRDIRQTVNDKKLILTLFLTASLISTNWLVFIWAIAENHVVETSLGYFINPLMNVALGIFLLGEKLSKVKMLAVGIAAIGVLYLIIMGGTFPWIALYLATSFALYGLFKKKILIGSILGLWIEMMMMLPFAIGYLIYLAYSAPPDAVGHDDYTVFMLVISGAVTTIPLVFFASAAQRLPLSTLGVLQYIAPSMSLILAVFLWNEPFTMNHMIAFGFIWGALAIYTVDNYFPRKKQAL